MDGADVSEDEFDDSILKDRIAETADFLKTGAP